MERGESNSQINLFGSIRIEVQEQQTIIVVDPILREYDPNRNRELVAQMMRDVGCKNDKRYFSEYFPDDSNLR